LLLLQSVSLSVMFLQCLSGYYAEVQMDVKGKKGSGVNLLKKRYRKKFRVPENVNYYSNEDFKKAEKKYLKLCLTTGNCR